MNFLKLKLNTSIFGSLAAVICVSIFSTSCEKTTDMVDTNVVEVEAEEGNKSTTNNDTSISIDESTEVLEPVLRMRFSKDLTQEEADAQWETEVNKFITQLKIEKPQLVERGVSTELFFSLRTKTGPQTHNGTDDTVYGRLNFASNRGNLTSKWFNLNNFGNDREEGNWDFYLLRAPIPGSPISWARARWAQLALKGTDGWFPTDFDIHIHTSDQTVPATGSSHIFASPNVWLDNSSSNTWDYYYTGVIGYGTLNF